ncbi:MAG TPA: hypothetical protein VMW27_17850 [Thermoanaerobaculia bacterium]|nr:hypothetical protein [Thermoanaerobaculia bacterium]
MILETKSGACAEGTHEQNNHPFQRLNDLSIESEPVKNPVTEVTVVNPEAGDFVGRDDLIFVSYKVHIHGDVHGDLVFPQDAKDRIQGQISQLRGRLARSIPVERALRELTRLREPKVVTPLWPLPGRRRPLPSPPSSSSPGSAAEEILAELREVERRLSAAAEPAARSEALRRLNQVIDKANGAISKLDFELATALCPALSSHDLLENLISKIGHNDLRNEAKVHLELVRKLQSEVARFRETSANPDVLSVEAQNAIGGMIDIAKRIRVVQALVRADHRRRQLTIFFVIVYIGLAMAATAGLAVFGPAWLRHEGTLEDQLMPVLRVPWPVVLWSLIGSFASMIHRFNRRPISDFGDAVKWLLTRPVQGLVLGAAFYLVVTSGLLLITGTVADGPGTPARIADEVLLVLAFLVGFSDRFGDRVFNTLVRRYAQDEPAAIPAAK